MRREQMKTQGAKDRHRQTKPQTQASQQEFQQRKHKQTKNKNTKGWNESRAAQMRAVTSGSAPAESETAARARKGEVGGRRGAGCCANTKRQK